MCDTQIVDPGLDMTHESCDKTAYCGTTIYIKKSNKQAQQQIIGVPLSLGTGMRLCMNVINKLYLSI